MALNRPELGKHFVLMEFACQVLSLAGSYVGIIALATCTCRYCRLSCMLVSLSAAAELHINCEFWVLSHCPCHGVFAGMHCAESGHVALSCKAASERDPSHTDLHTLLSTHVCAKAYLTSFNNPFYSSSSLALTRYHNGSVLIAARVARDC